MTRKIKDVSRYDQIVERIFHKQYSPGTTSFDFDRADINTTADELSVNRVLNLGDLLYTFRFRKPLPETILRTAPLGFEWIIEPKGRGKYTFCCAKISRILPREQLAKTKIPDSTPEIVSRYALGDEQALLAKVRYNRLIDIFLGITSYSLQNHLRTTVKGIGQIEIDELYIGLDRNGSHFVVPVQAKGGSDQIGAVQIRQDIAFCKERYPNLLCRAVATQFMADQVIAMFELSFEEGDLVVLTEKHYRLVPSSELSATDLKQYRQQSGFS